ncbi:hypothetical protein Smp_181260 [Schistosoma mansoni]|uniref:hypothetical protein n=1 Tax=Schistosoma mansoni TaxID=6183 RepID=UPI00022DBF9A|nr:hypothetical protein Smp_181260 [Schistosoma mansoni]|eukprot:XP_018651591.1 hypothetical protein Smp_181260 [Schistosoma mansoni]
MGQKLSFFVLHQTNIKVEPIHIMNCKSNSKFLILLVLFFRTSDAADRIMKPDKLDPMNHPHIIDELAEWSINLDSKLSADNSYSVAVDLLRCRNISLSSVHPSSHNLSLDDKLPANKESDPSSLSKINYLLYNTWRKFSEVLTFWFPPSQVLVTYAHLRENNCPWQLGYLSSESVQGQALCLVATHWLELMELPNRLQSSNSLSLNDLKQSNDITPSELIESPTISFTYVESDVNQTVTNHSTRITRKWYLSYVDPCPQWRIVTFLSYKPSEAFDHDLSTDGSNSTLDNLYYITAIGYSNGSIDIIDLSIDESERPNIDQNIRRSRIFIPPPFTQSTDPLGHKKPLFPVVLLSFIDVSHLLVGHFRGHVDLWHLDWKAKNFPARMMMRIYSINSYKASKPPILLSAVYDSSSSLLVLSTLPNVNVSVSKSMHKKLGLTCYYVSKKAPYLIPASSCSTSDVIPGGLMILYNAWKDTSVHLLCNLFRRNSYLTCDNSDAITSMTLANFNTTSLPTFSSSDISDQLLLGSLHSSGSYSVWLIPSFELLLLIANPQSNPNLSLSPINHQASNMYSRPFRITWWGRPSESDELSNQTVQLCVLHENGSIDLLDIQKCGTEFYPKVAKTLESLKLPQYPVFAIHSTLPSNPQSCLSEIVLLSSCLKEDSEAKLVSSSKTIVYHHCVRCIRLKSTTHHGLFDHYLRIGKFHKALKLNGSNNKTNNEIIYKQMWIKLSSEFWKIKNFQQFIQSTLDPIYLNQPLWIIKQCLNYIPKIVPSNLNYTLLLSNIQLVLNYGLNCLLSNKHLNNENNSTWYPNSNHDESESIIDLDHDPEDIIKSIQCHFTIPLYLNEEIINDPLKLIKILSNWFIERSIQIDKRTGLTNYALNFISMGLSYCEEICKGNHIDDEMETCLKALKKVRRDFIELAQIIYNKNISSTTILQISNDSTNVIPQEYNTNNSSHGNTNEYKLVSFILYQLLPHLAEKCSPSNYEELINHCLLYAANYIGLTGHLKLLESVRLGCFTDFIDYLSIDLTDSVVLNNNNSRIDDYLNILNPYQLLIGLVYVLKEYEPDHKVDQSFNQQPILSLSTYINNAFHHCPCELWLEIGLQYSLFASGNELFLELSKKFCLNFNESNLNLQKTIELSQYSLNSWRICLLNALRTYVNTSIPIRSDLNMVFTDPHTSSSSSHRMIDPNERLARHCLSIIDSLHHQMNWDQSFILEFHLEKCLLDASTFLGTINKLLPPSSSSSSSMFVAMETNDQLEEEEKKNHSKEIKLCLPSFYTESTDYVISQFTSDELESINDLYYGFNEQSLWFAFLMNWSKCNQINIFENYNPNLIWCKSILEVIHYDTRLAMSYSAIGSKFCRFYSTTHSDSYMNYMDQVSSILFPFLESSNISEDLDNSPCRIILVLLCYILVSIYEYKTIEYCLPCGCFPSGKYLCSKYCSFMISEEFKEQFNQLHKELMNRLFIVLRESLIHRLIIKFPSIDSVRFHNDPNYREDTIYGLCSTHFSFGLRLCSCYNLSQIEGIFCRLEYLFRDEDWMNDKIQKMINHIIQWILTYPNGMEILMNRIDQTIYPFLIQLSQIKLLFDVLPNECDSKVFDGLQIQLHRKILDILLKLQVDDTFFNSFSYSEFLKFLHQSPELYHNHPFYNFIKSKSDADVLAKVIEQIQADDDDDSNEITSLQVGDIYAIFGLRVFYDSTLFESFKTMSDLFKLFEWIAPGNTANDVSRFVKWLDELLYDSRFSENLSISQRHLILKSAHSFVSRLNQSTTTTINSEWISSNVQEMIKNNDHHDRDQDHHHDLDHQLMNINDIDNSLIVIQENVEILRTIIELIDLIIIDDKSNFLQDLWLLWYQYCEKSGLIFMNNELFISKLFIYEWTTYCIPPIECIKAGLNRLSNYYHSRNPSSTSSSYPMTYQATILSIGLLSSNTDFIDSTLSILSNITDESIIQYIDTLSCCYFICNHYKYWFHLLSSIENSSKIYHKLITKLFNSIIELLQFNDHHHHHQMIYYKMGYNLCLLLRNQDMWLEAARIYMIIHGMKSNQIPIQHIMKLVNELEFNHS